ncbi:Parapinopsin [Papilio machaon]|uniref:Parapinopsin n=1 Tax=Papilio machaon TaxID=76193 RepID=A0A194QM80_PAPMA|nr:Parapinopsin [Papilio machaon]
MTSYPDQFNDSIVRVVDEFPLLMPRWGYVMSAFVLFLIGFFGFFLNLLVIILMYKDKQLWTPLNIILFNLVCSDFSVSVLGNPLTLISALSHRWIFGRTMCVLYGFFMALLGITSITTLMVISFERYIMVTRPLRSRRLSPKGAAGLVVFIWAYSLALTTPPLIGWGSYVNEAANISCSVNWHEQSVNTLTYILFLFAMGQIVPFAVITFSYINIIRTLKKNSQRLGRVSRAESRATAMVFIMIVAFTVAWTPYSLFALLEQFAEQGIGDAVTRSGPWPPTVKLSTFSDPASSRTSPGSVAPEDLYPPHSSSDTWDGQLDTDHSVVPCMRISPGVGVIPALIAKSSICYDPLIYVGMNTQFRQSIRRYFSTLGRGNSETGKSCHNTILTQKLSAVNEITIRYNTSDSNLLNSPQKNVKNQIIPDNRNDATRSDINSRTYSKILELSTIPETKTPSDTEKSGDTVCDDDTSNDQTKVDSFVETCKLADHSLILTIVDSEGFFLTQAVKRNNNIEDLWKIWSIDGLEIHSTDALRLDDKIQISRTFQTMKHSYSLDFSCFQEKGRIFSVKSKQESYIPEKSFRMDMEDTKYLGPDLNNTNFKNCICLNDKKYIDDISL